MDNREYRVGRFTLNPFRQLMNGDVPVPVGRKALDLLSVLAKAEGALVTKDELMAAVWPKSIVEENVIQVHIAALRKALGEDAELLVTVHGLGYRLAAAPETFSASPKTEMPPEVVPVTAPRRRTAPILWAVLPIIAIAAAGLWFLLDRPSQTPGPREARVVVLPFDIIGPEKPLRGVAAALLDEIVGQLSESQIQAVSPTESKALRRGDGAAVDRLGANTVLDGTVQGDGKAINIRLHLDDVREHVVIWAGEFHGSADRPEALEATAAAQTADALYWIKTGRSGKARLDAASLAAFIAGREATTGVRNSSDGVDLADYRKVVAASPDFSWGHSAVAAMEGFQVREQRASHDLDALRADARAEARRALALEPHNGEAWLALELSTPLLDWQGREALLVQGIAADPNFQPTVMMEGRLVWGVGRGKDAYAWLKRAHDIDGLDNGDAWSLALNLASEGRPAESRAVLEKMALQWPDHYATRNAHFWVNVVTGATDDALAELADPAARPSPLDQQAIDAWSAALKATASKKVATRAEAAKTVTQAANSGSLGRGPAMVLLAMLGDLDGAFAQAQLYEPVVPSALPYLFLPPTAPMRSDPRFMLLARRLGLVAYWRSTGKWPDFCADPGLAYNCQTEANRLNAAK